MWMLAQRSLQPGGSAFRRPDDDEMRVGKRGRFAGGHKIEQVPLTPDPMMSQREEALGELLVEATALSHEALPRALQAIHGLNHSVSTRVIMNHVGRMPRVPAHVDTAVTVLPHPPVPRPTYLELLEAESIHILREVVAESRKPVMLYSIGKDSSVMLHIARKAFSPARLPFPLLHVDTTWKFREMIRFRDETARRHDLDLIVHVNRAGVDEGINPFEHGSALYTEIMKTRALTQALEAHGFDAAIGGARRDEEKSRAKERVVSVRSPQHRWDPKRQRPELWRLYNARTANGETVRVFPLSNWTELDVWLYIYLERIPVVALYLAKPRPVVRRAGGWIMVDDDRMRLEAGERPELRKVRFRTLGCYPLSAGIESDAETLPAVIQEMLTIRTSERQGRLIDHDQPASMEEKKRDGYF